MTSTTTEAGSRPADQTTPLLELRGVNKSFGAVQVLHDVDLTVRLGQVTALVGDNGAGKSTLIKGIAGIHAFDSGDYLFEGEHGARAQPEAGRTRSASRSSTRTSRCATTSTSSRTCTSAARRCRPASSTRSSMEERAAETLAGLSVRTVKSVRQKVASLSGGQRQTVAIARAVLWNSKLVILDEPTAALGVAQTEQVLRLVRRLADRGLAVILISHNMNDVLAVADDIAVLYLGRMTAQVRGQGRRHSEVVELITGGALVEKEGHVVVTDPHDDRPRTRPAPTRRETSHDPDRREQEPQVDLGARADRSAATPSASTSPGSAAATSGRCRPSSAWPPWSSSSPRCARRRSPTRSTSPTC